MNAKFKGFPAGNVEYIKVPEMFFRELLPEIDHAGELKVTLYVIWLLNQKTGRNLAIREAEIAADSLFMSGMGNTQSVAREVLVESLSRAVQRGSLLQAAYLESGEEMTLYFLNSPKGRAAWAALRRGEWHPTYDQDTMAVSTLSPEKENIFKQYERNIGPLTPMMADALKDAEKTYPNEWIEEAIKIAVERNVRNWRYIEAILKNWQQGEKDAQETRRSTQEDSLW